MVGLLLQRRPSTDERGAHLVELAIGLPLFIGLLFAMFDTARVSLATSAVRAAVYQGTRRAVGVRRPVTNPFFSSAFSSDPISATSLMGEPLFDNLPGPIGTPYYGQTAAPTEPYRGPAQVFRVETIAMAYAYRIIMRSFGNVKYPCEESNCARCVSLRGSPQYSRLLCESACPLDTSATPAQPDAACVADCQAVAPNAVFARYLALECTIYVPVMTTSVFMGWLPERIGVTADAYVSMENQAEVIFDPKYGS